MVWRCQYLVIFVIVVVLFEITETKPRQHRSLANQTDKFFEFSDDSMNSLEDALSVLTNLTATQRDLWEQQQLREEELRAKFQADQEKEAARTKAMEEEHRLLNEMKGKISRKLRSMSKNTPAVYATNDQGSSPNVIRPKDCADLYLDAEETSGIYRVWPTWDRNGKGFLVYCDMETDGGGWTVIRRWGNNKFSNDFFKKTWQEYKIGFGDIQSDFWLGNAQVYELTNQGSYELRLDISTSVTNESTIYHKFWIDSESDKYRLHIDEIEPTSTAGDILASHDDSPFSASDINHVVVPPHLRGYNYREDQRPKCSIGWWFKQDCSISSFLTPHEPSSGSHKKEMKIRPAHFLKLKESM